MKFDKIKLIKELRERTGLGLAACRDALDVSQFDIQRAIDFMRKTGLIAAESRTQRKTSEGRVQSYIHGEGRVGVLLQVDCETDFVARTEEFKTFMHELCLQIASMAPKYISRESIPADVLLKEMDACALRARESGKKEAFLSKIVAGQIEKWYAQVCLLDQAWVKDKDKKVNDLLVELIQKTGENVRVTKFARFEAGVAE